MIFFQLERLGIGKESLLSTLMLWSVEEKFSKKK